MAFFEGMKGELQKNVSMGNLKMQNVPVRLWECVLKLTGKEDDNSREEIVLNVSALQGENAEMKLSVKSSKPKPSMQKISKKEDFQPNVLPSGENSLQNEIDEIIKVLKQVFSSVGSENREVLNIKTLEFKEFKDANVLAHKMTKTLEKASKNEFKTFYNQFNEKVNSLIILSESKGCGVNFLHQLKECSRQCLAVFSKTQLQKVQKLNSNHHKQDEDKINASNISR